MKNVERYQRVPVVHYPEREWPGKEIQKAPAWCSVDLRDGNQALVEPMVVEEKIEMFNLLVEMGFKEIEIGFPAASQIEFDFLRQLVDRNLIPRRRDGPGADPVPGTPGEAHLRGHSRDQRLWSTFTIPHPLYSGMWYSTWTGRRSKKRSPQTASPW